MWGTGLTFGLFGWLRLGLWTGALSAAPNMLLVGPPGGLVFCGWATVSGPPKISLVFPPMKKHNQNISRVYNVKLISVTSLIFC